MLTSAVPTLLHPLLSILLRYTHGVIRYPSTVEGVLLNMNLPFQRGSMRKHSTGATDKTVVSGDIPLECPALAYLESKVVRLTF